MSHELLHLDLYSGIGGFTLGFEAAGFRTICHVECDPDRQRDLRHHWPDVPIIGDVNDIEAICRVVADAKNKRYTSKSSNSAKQVWENGKVFTDGREFRDELVRYSTSTLVLSAGVPCQPASAAGRRKASADDRWLWPQTIRVVDRLRPDWLVFENPLGLASLAEPAAIPGVDLERLRAVPGRTVCEILTAIRLLGYEFSTDRDGHPWIPVVPAAGVGAFHGRDRMWIIARRGDVGDGERTGLSERVLQRGIQGVAERGAQVQAAVLGSEGTRLAVDDAPGSRHAQAGIGPELREQRRGECLPSNGSAGTLPDWSDAILERGNDGVWRAIKPGLRLLAHGVSRRTSKLKGFGNSAVPQVVYQIAKAIREAIETGNPDCSTWNSQPTTHIVL